MATWSCLLLAACGGGGSTKSGGEEEGGGKTTPKHYLFFSSYVSTGWDGLKALSPDTPSAPVSVEGAGTTIEGPALLTVGDWGGTSGSITHAYTHSLVYLKLENNDWKVFRAGGLAADTPRPVRVGSFQVDPAFYIICSTQVFPDYADPMNSLIVVRWTGTTGSCDTPRAAVLVLSDGPTQELHTLPDPAAVLGVVRNTSGAITNVIAVSNGKLVSESPDLASETVLASTPTVRLVVEWAGKTWIQAGSSLKYLAAGGTALVDAPGSISFGNPVKFAFDETRLFFVETVAGATIYSLPLDGSSAPSIVRKLEATEIVTDLLLTAGRVVYRDDTSKSWKSVPKSGGAAVTLFTGTDGYAGTAAGTSVFIYDDSLAVSVAEDGTDLVEHSKAHARYVWTFVGADAFPVGSGRDRIPGHAILAEEAKSGGVSLSSFDVLTRKLVADMGSLGADYLQVMTLAEGSGGRTLVMSQNMTDSDVDLYFVDASKGGDTVPVAVTVGVDEDYVGSGY